MEKNERRYSVRSLIVVSVIAELVSSFTLWLVESPIKYPLFIIETLVIITTYAVLNKYELRISYDFNPLKRFSTLILLDLLLISFSSFLVISNQFHFGDATIRLVFAYICTSGLTGFALLSIFGITKYFSKLEILVLSFITSFILSGALTMSFIGVDETIRSLIISFVFIILGVTSLLKHYPIREVNSNNLNSLSNKIDIILILLCVSFYALFFYYVYPKFTLIPGTDIARTYSSSIILSRTPDLSSGFIAMLFNAYSSTLNVLSWADKTSFLTIQIISNFILPLSVYVVAKRFLSDIDKRIPILSTVFYSFTSNLSFIYFVYLKLQGTTDTEFNLLGWTVAQKSWAGTMYSFSNILNFTPTSLELIMFSFALLLLKVLDMPRLKFVILYTLLIFAMYLEHVAGAIILLFIIVIYSMGSKTKSLRLDDVLISFFIAFVLSTISLACYEIFWISPMRVSGISLSTMLPVIAPLLLVSISIFWRRAILNRFNLKLRFPIHPTFYLVLSTCLVATYLFGILTWFFIDDFQTYLVYEAGVIPWFIYPIGLGIVGLLSLIAIRNLNSIVPNSSVQLLFISIGFLFLMGRAVSFANLNLFNTDYWENRFLYFIFLFASLVAPLSLVKMADKNIFKQKFILNLSLPIIISLIFFCGVSSLVLQIEFWSKDTTSHILPQAESDAQNYLKNVIQKDPHTFTISPLLRNYVLDPVITPYQYATPEIFIHSVNPEIPMFALSTHNLSHAYIYMNKTDPLDLQNSGSWFADHYLPTIPVIFSNEKIIIYNATHISYPRSNSDNHLLIPADSNFKTSSLFYASDVISKHDANYTMMFDLDRNALSAKTVILSYDLPENDTLPDFYDKFTSLKDWRIILGNWHYSTDGLHERNSLENSKGIILSPVSSQNFLLNTSFRIIEADPSVPNYVSVVNSWTDANNYEMAEIGFVNNNVYVSHISVKEGKVFSDSSWPGNATKLSWASGNSFNVTLSKQGKFEDLFVNGTKYLHSESANNSGYLGLSATRIQNISFDHFSITKLSKFNLRDMADYLEYVRKGGNLIVLNTNGNGLIYGNLFKMENSSIISNKIVGLGKITYVNIFPIISGFEKNNISALTLQKTLDEISSQINLEKINPNSKPDISKFIFKSMTANGTVTINTTSFIFPNQQFSNMTIKTNGTESLIKNVSKLNVGEYDYVILRTNYISLASGSGLYSDQYTGNSLTMLFNKNTTVGVISDDEKSYDLHNVSEIFIKNDRPIHFYAWKPGINATGEISLKETYGTIIPTQQKYQGTSREVPHQDVKISGKVYLSIFMSDVYTICDHLSIGGKIKALDITQTYDEMNSTLASFSKFTFTSLPASVNMILIIPVVIAVVLLLVGNNKKMKRL